MRYGCKRFFDSYRFFSSSLDKLVKPLVGNSYETLRKFKEEFVDNDETLNNVTEIVEEDGTVEDLKKVLQIKLRNWKKLNLLIWAEMILKN